MVSTVFVNGVTLSDEDWFNDLNRLHYTILGDPATLAAFKTTTFGSSYPVNHGPVMRAAADQSITASTSLTNATDLGFSIAASEEWVADFYLDVGALVSSTGIKLAVTVPASATLNAIGQWIGIGSVNQCHGARTTTSGAALDFTATDMTSVSNALIHVSVWVLNSTNAGTVQLQFAQSTSNATAITIRKGSHGDALRVA